MTTHPYRGPRRTVLARVLAALAATALAVIATAALPAAPAWAHNQLTTAEPAPQSTLDTSPEQVVLEFVEPLNPRYTAIVVTDAAGMTVSDGQPEITGNRGAVTFAAPLAGGAYTVAYRVVSLDGHPVQGSYPFTVAGPEPAADATDAVSAPATDAPVDAASVVDDGGGSGTLLALAGAGLALVVAVVAAGVWRARRARP
ncbi:copper resistance CopC family protein [Polymorphospora sp. NPDC051019]